MEIQNKVLELLDFSPNIEFTEKFENGFEGMDLRNTIHPKINTNTFIQPYYQVFEQKYGFQNNLSIIDLLFNMGNEALLIIN